MGILLMHQSLSERKLVSVKVPSHNVWTVEAACLNCNKRFTSMRAVSMHLIMTGTCHVVNFINYGNYNKRTGLTEANRLRSYIMNIIISCSNSLDEEYYVRYSHTLLLNSSKLGEIHSKR
jgi:hypothetical protein